MNYCNIEGPPTSSTSPPPPHTGELYRGLVLIGVLPSLEHWGAMICYVKKAWKGRAA
jgi:hypothetical protein